MQHSCWALVGLLASLAAAEGRSQDPLLPKGVLDKDKKCCLCAGLSLTNALHFCTVEAGKTLFGHKGCKSACKSVQLKRLGRDGDVVGLLNAFGRWPKTIDPKLTNLGLTSGKSKGSCTSP